MTSATIDSFIRLNKFQAEAVSEAFSVCMPDFFKQDNYVASNEFMRFFEPTIAGEPISGLWNIFDPNCLGYDGKEYHDANAKLTVHNDDSGEYRVQADDACIEAVLSILRRVCALDQTITLFWYLNDENGCALSDKYQCSLVTSSGESSWYVSDVERPDRHVDEGIRSLILQAISFEANMHAQIGDSARSLSTYEPERIECAYMAPSLSDAAQKLCQDQPDLPIRAFTGWVKQDEDALIIDRLLSYSDHVAILGLISLGHDRQEACISVASGAAGAFLGDANACPGLLRRAQSNAKIILSKKFENGAEWTVWQSEAEIYPNIVSAVNGWKSTGSICPFEDVIERPLPVSLH